jgi:pyruvate dehydrogenase E2 component (dihydrolipoamide acetyltransferase)
MREVILPKLGQTMEQGTIVEWLKQEGEPIDRGDVLFTLESDKATLEVEAPSRGYLRRVLVPAGQEVPVLTVVALITKTEDEDISGYAPTKPGDSPPTVSTDEPSGNRLTTSESLGAQALPGRTLASPRAKRLAREEGVNLSLLAGTGPGGRIVEQDVEAYLRTLPPATPVARRLADSAHLDLRQVQGTGAGGRVTKADVLNATGGPASRRGAGAASARAEQAPASAVPLAGIRAVTARHMHSSHQTTAPVTLTTEVDATAFVGMREQVRRRLAKELGFDIGYNDLLIKVVAQALTKFPYMNSRLEEDTITTLTEIHVALAVDSERGLLVPVIRDADKKTLVDVAQEVRTLVKRARAGSALPDDLSGSTFTITNLGMYEVDCFTPIINLPEVAILGVGRIRERPAVIGGEIGIRNTMWLSMTFDHRIVDGAPAARFLQYLKDLVESPHSWLLESTH